MGTIPCFHPQVFDCSTKHNKNALATYLFMIHNLHYFRLQCVNWFENNNKNIIFFSFPFLFYFIN